MSGDHRLLRDKLLWRKPFAATDRFLTIIMDQNNRCNLKCRMCGFSDSRVDALPKYDLPRWLFDSIASQLFPLANYVQFSCMTEPFMTRDFPERLDAARLFAVPFSDVITNGTMLTDRTLDALIDARISRLTVSVDGGTKAVYEYIRVGANFEQVIRNIRRFQAQRLARGSELPMLRITHVLTESNIDYFSDFLDLMREIRPEMIQVRTIERMSNAQMQEPTDERFWNKLRAIRAVLGDFAHETGIEHSDYLRPSRDLIELFTDAGEKLSCQRPWDSIAIHPNGDVQPCLSWTRPPIGNLASETFDAIWNGEKLRLLRAEFERQRPGIDCLNCTIKKDVPGAEHDDFFYRKVSKSPVF